MKLTIGDYEVTISAKYTHSKRANKEDTAYLLNELAIALYECSQRYKQMNLNSISKHNLNLYHDITEKLVKEGFIK